MPPETDIPISASSAINGGNSIKSNSDPPPETDIPISPTSAINGDNSIKSNSDPPPESSSDLPPDSYCLPKDRELDWFDRNAVMERKGSTKTISSCCNNSNQTQIQIQTPNRASNSSSQRSKSKLSILSLPKPQKACFADGSLRRVSRPEKARLFRSRSEPDMKSPVQLSEPASPRVSCIGRVRSRRAGGKRTGFWVALRAVFVAAFRGNRAVQKAASGLVEPKVEPGDLVGPKRLVSGMRSESWGGGR